MKLSELIAQLQKELEIFGDLPISIDSGFIREIRTYPCIDGADPNLVDGEIPNELFFEFLAKDDI